MNMPGWAARSVALACEQEPKKVSRDGYHEVIKKDTVHSSDDSGQKAEWAKFDLGMELLLTEHDYWPLLDSVV